MGKLEKIEERLEIDHSRAINRISRFIEQKVETAGAEGVVLGLSGGLDSATTAFLSERALGKDSVLAVFMPEEGVTSPREIEDAEEVAETLDLDFRTIEISSIFEEIKKNVDIEHSPRMANANLKVRVRMLLLYYYANSLDYLVIGTSNESELRAGYFTKYGDGAVDFFPLGTVYKLQTKEIARELGVPKRIIEKPPSAGLWEGQEDEDELGLPYEKIDRIWAGLDLDFSAGEIAECLDIDESQVEGLMERENRTEHKRRMPPSPDI